jgi:hypothetical protein
MQIPLLSGRIFNANEPDAVIVSRRLALEMYGRSKCSGANFPCRPVGRSKSSAPVATLSAPQGTIVAVPPTRTQSSRCEDVAELYRPLKIATFSEVELVARARTDA